MEAFRDFLDAWLARAGLTPTQLAERSGVSQSLISKWLHADPRRRATPSPKNLERLARVVGVAHEDLMRMCGHLPGSADLGGAIDPQLAIVNETWPRLKESVREAITILVRA